MSLDCSRIAKEMVMASGFFGEGRRQTTVWTTKAGPADVGT